MRPVVEVATATVTVGVVAAVELSNDFEPRPSKLFQSEAEMTACREIFARAKGITSANKSGPNRKAGNSLQSFFKERFAANGEVLARPHTRVMTDCFATVSLRKRYLSIFAGSA